MVIITTNTLIQVVEVCGGRIVEIMAMVNGGSTSTVTMDMNGDMIITVQAPTQDQIPTGAQGLFQNPNHKPFEISLLNINSG